jgi:trehalose-6-phosphatase
MMTVSPLERDVRRLAPAVALLAQGRSNARGTVTLTVSDTTTTVTDATINEQSVINLMPTTANAAAALATTYISSRSNGSFILTHANNAQADRTFDWSAVGG